MSGRNEVCKMAVSRWIAIRYVRQQSSFRQQAVLASRTSLAVKRPESAAGKPHEPNAAERRNRECWQALPNASKRLFFLAAMLFLWIAGVCFRLVQMQVLQYGDWEQRALRQQSRTITVEPRRGVIYDRNGSELAMSIDVDSIFAVPSEIPEPETTAGILGNVLHLDPQEIVARMKASRNFAWVSAPRGCRDQRTSSRPQPQGHLLPERAQAFLSQARAGVAGTGLRRHG